MFPLIKPLSNPYRELLKATWHCNSTSAVLRSLNEKPDNGLTSQNMLPVSSYEVCTMLRVTASEKYICNFEKFLFIGLD
jgi:hypothetical protein